MFILDGISAFGIKDALIFVIRRWESDVKKSSTDKPSGARHQEYQAGKEDPLFPFDPQQMVHYRRGRSSSSYHPGYSFRGKLSKYSLIFYLITSLFDNFHLKTLRWHWAQNRLHMNLSQLYHFTGGRMQLFTAHTSLLFSIRMETAGGIFEVK